jgi:hypothetical protein
MILLKKTRVDGTLIREVPPFTRLLPYIMPDKKGSVIYYEQHIDVTDTLKLVKQLNREMVEKGTILTLFDVILCAAARTVAFRPRANRFITHRRYYQRNRIEFNFVAKKTLSDEGQEFNVKIPFSPFETLETTAIKVKQYVKKAVSEDVLENEKVVRGLMRIPDGLLFWLINFMNRLDDHNLMPKSLLESDPMWCTMFLTNTGSFGMEAPFHHLYERGNCPLFMAVGKVRGESRMNDKGELLHRQMVTVRYSYDDRIADGVYMGKTLELFRRFVEKPSVLMEPPEIPEDTLSELMLKG